MYQTDHSSAWRAPTSQGENFSLFPKLIVLLPSKCWRPSDLKTQDRCLGTSIYNIFVYIFTYIVWFIKVMINNLEWFEYWVLFTGLRAFSLIVTKAFSRTHHDAVALLSFRADVNLRCASEISKNGYTAQVHIPTGTNAQIVVRDLYSLYLAPPLECQRH